MSKKCKIALKLNRVYFDSKSGKAEIEILDPDMIEPLKFTLSVNDMVVAKVKEWYEVGEA